MLRLMLKLEAGIHRDGWDRPPRLCSILRRGDALSLSDPLPIPWDGSAGAVLAGLADEMDGATERGKYMAYLMAQIPGFYGMLFACEAWGNDQVGPARTRDRALADIVGSYELRGVVAADIKARVYTVSRRRGEKPRAEAITKIGGRAVDATVRIVKAVAAHLPDGSEVDREALAALKVMTADEMIAEHNERQDAADPSSSVRKKGPR
jgi:hypothetical protein